MPEAAEILGTTTDAVRSRMRRGKLQREEGEDGTVYVLLEGGKSGHGTNGRETVEDRRETVADSRETVNPTVADGRETVEDGPLVEVLRDQVDYLREQLDKERESSSELRRIIAAMTQRVPVVELEAPQDERGGSEKASEGTVKGDVPPEQQKDVQRRSWLYRFFFGP